jgi:hypothetical protein
LIRASYRIVWSKTYGPGTASCVIKTTDGGYAITGGNANGSFIIKTDSNGNMHWNRSYGFSAATSIAQTNDGGYVIVGPLASNPFASNSYFLKTDSGGNPQWTQSFASGSAVHVPHHYEVIKTTDGGCAFTNLDCLVKTDSNGNIQWIKKYDQTGIPVTDLFSLIQTADGGYAIVGFAGSIMMVHSTQACLIKTDSSGNNQWKTMYKQPASPLNDGQWNGFEDIIEVTGSNGYAMAGYTGSIDNGVSAAYLVKTDQTGVMQWSQKYNEITNAKGGGHGYSILETSDGYAIAGDILYNSAAHKNCGFLIKTDSSGNMDWQFSYYGSATSMVMSNDGAYIIAGSRNSQIYLAKVRHRNMVTPTPGSSPIP